MPINLSSEPCAADRSTEELEQLTTKLADCVFSAASAQGYAALWSDSISIDVEGRLSTEVGDERNWAEPDYAATLDAFDRAQRLQHHIAAETAAILGLLIEEAPR